MEAWRAIGRHLATGLSAAVFLSQPVGADCGKDPECDMPGPWTKFTAITMTSSEAGAPGAMSWKGAFDHASGDFLLDLDSRMPGMTMKGSVGMVEGRIMLSKGLDLERGREIDAVDGPVLSLQLLTILLGRVFPKGPESIPPKAPISHVGKTGIKFASPSASGYVPPQWKLDGEVRRRNGGAVEYNLRLNMRTDPRDDKKAMIISMGGVLAERTVPVFDDGMSLDGWKVYGVGPQVEKRGGSTLFDYGAKPQSDPAMKTVADIRRFIIADRHPGTPDRTKDFTGFWKEKCENAFGLQVKRGSDGMYSIVFCGPGGCGDDADARRTFITGDKRFEVVSEDELVEVSRNGDRERIYRCTRETNPVLEYKK